MAMLALIFSADVLLSFKLMRNETKRHDPVALVAAINKPILVLAMWQAQV